MKSAKSILSFVNAKIKEYTSAIAAESNPILKEHLKHILAEYSAIKGFITIDDEKWVDLGLPSGRLWAAENEPGYHQFDEAFITFGKQLPPADAWQELFDQCSHKWDNDRKGCVLTGPNGNTLFLPADGWQQWNEETKDLNGGRVDFVGGYGHYWSSSPCGVDYARNVDFSSDYFFPQSYNYRLHGFSVRLARESR